MDRRSFGAKLAAGFGTAILGCLGIGGAQAKEPEVVWEETPTGAPRGTRYTTHIEHLRVHVIDYRVIVNDDDYRIYAYKPPQFMLSWAAKYPKSGPESLDGAKRLAVRYARTVAEFERVNGIDENGVVRPTQ